VFFLIKDRLQSKWVGIKRDCGGLDYFEKIYKEVPRCQCLNTSVTNAVTRWISWKKAVVRASTSAKNVGVQIRKNCFQVFPLDKVAGEAIPAQPESVQPERADFLRKNVV